MILRILLFSFLLITLLQHGKANRFYPGKYNGLAPNVTGNALKTLMLRKSITVFHTSASSAVAAAISDDGIVFGARTNSGLRAYRVGGSTVSELWRSSTNTGWTIPPIISPDGSVIIIGGNAGVHCFNATTGSFLWKYELLVGGNLFDPIQSVFSDDGANVFVSANGPQYNGRCWCTDGSSTFSNIGSVHLIRVADGSKIWAFTPSWPCPPFGTINNCGIPSNFPLPLGGLPRGIAQISATKVLVALGKLQYLGFWGNSPNQWPPIFSGRKGGVSALDLATGSVLWEKELPEGSTTPIYLWPSDSSKVIVGSLNELYALDADGTQLWMVQTNGQIIHLILSSAAIFLFYNSFEVTAIRLVDGSVLWSTFLTSTVFPPFLLVANSDLICVTESQVLALNSSSGSSLWSFAKLSTFSFAGAASIDVSGTLFVPTTTGEYAVISKCSPGYYCPSITIEIACPAGTFSAGNADACMPCPVNSYNPSERAISLASCRPCPNGTSSISGSVSCDWSIQQFGAFNQSSCPMKLFPSADLAGERLDTFVSSTEDHCAGACCGRSHCLGFSFTHFGASPQTCTLLSNISYVIPSSTMSGGIRAAVLGL
jgi:outer membrane protein assembly factor BamB